MTRILLKLQSQTLGGEEMPASKFAGWPQFVLSFGRARA